MSREVTGNIPLDLLLMEAEKGASIEKIEYIDAFFDTSDPAYLLTPEAAESFLDYMLLWDEFN